MWLHKRFIKDSFEKKKKEKTMDKFAVIDTETNWIDEEDACVASRGQM